MSGGYYCIVTSEQINAKQALNLYKSRDASEKLFRGDKSYLGNNCVSLFEITKDSDNKSHIKECVDESDRTGAGMINVNPVRFYYDSLWHDYKTTKSPETLMNVCRQIPEYYFIQMCGFKNSNLRTELLDENESDFIRKRDDGSIDRSRYNIASAMIALLNVGATGFTDGLYFDSSAADFDQIKYVFRRLFEIKHQEQHYKMMMQED